MVSCQKGPTRHAYAWQIGAFWQDTLDFSGLSGEFLPGWCTGPRVPMMKAMKIGTTNKQVSPSRAGMFSEVCTLLVCTDGYSQSLRPTIIRNSNHNLTGPPLLTWFHYDEDK